jgi:hypothetical protein
MLVLLRAPLANPSRSILPNPSPLTSKPSAVVFHQTLTPARTLGQRSPHIHALREYFPQNPTSINAKIPQNTKSNTSGPPSSMHLRGTPSKTKKKTKSRFPHFNSLRNSAWILEIPPKQFPAPRDPLSGVFTCVPLLQKFPQKLQSQNPIRIPFSWPQFQPSLAVLVKGRRPDSY